MARYLDTDELLDSATTPVTRSLLDYKTDVVNLRPGPTGASVSKIRLLGLPLGFREHSNKMRGPEGGKRSVTVAFPDASENHSFTRVCTETNSCPWCKLGYLSSQRYNMNVIDRAGCRVKIISKGKMVFTKFAEQERANKQINAENLADDPNAELLWTQIGSDYAPDVRITSRVDLTQLGEVSHTITFAPRPNLITPDQMMVGGYFCCCAEVAVWLLHPVGQRRVVSRHAGEAGNAGAIGGTRHHSNVAHRDLLNRAVLPGDNE
ncbi:MAG: hypothetical protein JWN14_1563, partial [Chthonomonadales bacterium]|nr:hypothetical protein [Chthonomonadales bacterium]